MSERIRRAETETYSHAISALLTKRAALCGEAQGYRDKLQSLDDDVTSLDRALRVLGYQGRLDALLPPTVRDAPHARGEVMRAVLNAMREAGRPMTVRAVALGAFGSQFRDSAEPAVVESYTRRVSKALQRLKRDGAVCSASDGPHSTMWSLATI